MDPVNYHRQHHDVKINWDIAYIYIFHMYQQQNLTAFVAVPLESQFLTMPWKVLVLTVNLEGNLIRRPLYNDYESVVPNLRLISLSLLLFFLLLPLIFLFLLSLLQLYVWWTPFIPSTHKWSIINGTDVFHMMKRSFYCGHFNLSTNFCTCGYTGKNIYKYNIYISEVIYVHDTKI